MESTAKGKLKFIRSILQDKVFILVGNSPGVSFLVKNREFFRDRDYVFGSMTTWVPIEEDFLKPIDKEFQFITCGSKKFELMYDNVNRDYTQRDTPNIFMPGNAKRCLGAGYQSSRILSFSAICPWTRPGVADAQIFNMDSDMFAFPALHTPLLMTTVAVLGLAKAVFIFGCDGGHTDDVEGEDRKYCHYKCDRGCPTPKPKRYNRDIHREQPIFERFLPRVTKQAKIKAPPLHLVGKHSLYLFTDKVDKADVFDLMATYD